MAHVDQRQATWPLGSVKPEVRSLLDRAVAELGASALLAENGFAAQAVSRAYYAAFYAAEAALAELGVVRSKHAGVVSAFGQLLVRDRGLDPNAGRHLRSLFERRSRADYDPAEVPIAEAERALVDARLVVEVITAWLDVV